MADNENGSKQKVAYSIPTSLFFQCKTQSRMNHSTQVNQTMCRQRFKNGVWNPFFPSIFMICYSYIPLRIREMSNCNLVYIPNRDNTPIYCRGVQVNGTNPIHFHAPILQHTNEQACIWSTLPSVPLCLFPQSSLVLNLSLPAKMSICDGFCCSTPYHMQEHVHASID